MKRRSKTTKKLAKSARQHQAKLINPETFYSSRPWCDIWLDKFSCQQLEFWVRINDLNSVNLLAQLEKAGFLRRVDENSDLPRFFPESSYYNDLKFILIGYKPPAPYALIPQRRVFHRPKFIRSCHRAWTSMRILHIFSASQILICSEISELVVLEFVYQMHKTNFLRLVEGCDAEILGSENIYQLVKNTGPSAPLICADGIVYDINTRTIYMTQY
ncbi:MAG: hypothetical protein CLLPBCKN_007689 [Chroococcidiopsis cubana SAG 39.79]|uniref:Uncharacterized protein n=1 Tax=Chroococcidiopsis cubana SAG 39.79 TaxID=388085 RepID=A0AB37UTA2_9CYAN|nr:hypothetical protein [Chroococcidiopsis cubana]MDZ4878254.1 hypothetical protein [Chroococcidiopsis cubana SAG 39.79]PSB64450.1 hypothetical protein C7B79_09675 [Chroococcidiopsis cubana CCALA 043]RUT14492.1 hypothetical protein DSM107010_00380 [Chroococcidiopsis cubana SAG 39.79]